MKTRQEIKAIGKEKFKLNYWNCVLAALLVTAVMGAISWIGSGQEITRTINGEYGEATVSLRSNVGSLLTILLGGPLTIGLNSFFVRNIKGQTQDLTVTTPFNEAFQNYPRKLGGSLWMGLFVFLWSLLLIIPGIIKSISYSMTPYILADCPNVKARDALKLSMRMMEGHKWEYFVMGLSFIGWILLSLFTLGLVSVFYAQPYMNSSFAAYYLEVRNEALRTGAVTYGQMNGVEAV